MIEHAKHLGFRMIGKYTRANGYNLSWQCSDCRRRKVLGQKLNWEDYASAVSATIATLRKARAQ